ncbi:hypothetical protein QOZ80_1AG0003970 [Eleusine coracana subsp. coracana]|nr:hypothetical protein QOZ80_1AG0003970 [Eleusine coracana subsp. coracana]
MAEIGGMLAAAVLKLVATKVAEAAGDRFMLQWRFGEDMEIMKETMESIAAVLKDAERRSIKEEAVRLWLKRLTGVSYRITDIFDEFEVSSIRKSALRKFKVLNPYLTLASEVRMAGKMKVVREKLDSISNERDKYSLATSSSSNDQQVINDRATSPEVIQAEIIGRDEEKQKIVALLSTSSNFIILPICGIGGIGKTTLAQLLFNDTYFKDYKKAWVYVSQTFDLNTIKESVRSQLRLEQGQLAKSQEQNAGSLAPKSILIVLDDLWEQDDMKMDDLKKSLKMVGKGHKVHIIVTTRDAGIAQKIQTVEAHNIKALAPEVCWTIIKKIADFENRSDKEMLKDIGNEISGKCGGVALAARAVGFMLRSRDIDGWVSVKDSALWNVSTPGYTTSAYDNVLASLKLSYSSMLPHLRLCFAYCAVFPKGHKMVKDELIYQWAALGFIMRSDGISIQQHGEAYIKQLLDMSFFQRSEYRFVRKYDTLFTMHDLVHDLARSIMGDDLLHVSKEFIKCGRSSCRYAFLADCGKPLNSYVTYPDNIRALHFLGSGGTGHSSVGFSTASLRKLHTLDLTDCFELKELPKNMDRMDSLKFLIGVDYEIIPINKNLIPLPNFIVHDVEGEQSSNLILLKDVNPDELKISRLENVKSKEEARRIELRGKQTLTDLALDWTRGTNGYVEDMELLRELVPPSSLKRFELRGYNSMSFPAWLTGTAIYLPNLCRVQLKNLPTCNSLPPLGELANLRYLNLEDMPNITKIDRGFCGDGMKAFPRLEELLISEMENLEQWITTYPCGENVADEFMFPNLEKLEIRRCPNLIVKPCPPRVKKTWYINDSDGVLSQWEEDVPHTVCSTSSAPVLHTLEFGAALRYANGVSWRRTR